MQTFVDSLIETLDPKPQGLVGSSFGSFSILSHLLGDRSSGLPSVHFGCPALAPGSTLPLPFMLQMIPGLRTLMLKLQPPTVGTARKMFRMIGHGKSMDHGRMPDDGFRWYAALLSETDTRENDLALFGSIRPRHALTEDELRSLSYPTSFFWGADDPFGGPDVGHKLAEIIPDAEIEMIDDAGHLPWLDVPERAARHLTDFMSRQPS
jgi:pimeloyl-ACP methyl ester carboxylesterase